MCFLRVIHLILTYFQFSFCCPQFAIQNSLLSSSPRFYNEISADELLERNTVIRYGAERSVLSFFEILCKISNSKGHVSSEWGFCTYFSVSLKIVHVCRILCLKRFDFNVKNHVYTTHRHKNMRLWSSKYQCCLIYEYDGQVK